MTKPKTHPLELPLHTQPCHARPLALGPMAEATLAWAEKQAQCSQTLETFEQWYDSLDAAFAAFDAKKAS